MDFFSVCQFKKSKYIPKNCSSLKKFYGNHSYSVIVPSNEENLFLDFFKKNNIDYISIINENKYIHINSFYKIYTEISSKYKVKYLQTEHLGWYYQQVLKLSHLFTNNGFKHIVMIDSDTILIKKLEFFKFNHGIVYFSNYEHNIYYKESCLDIFGSVAEPWRSSTVQTFSTSQDDISCLFNKLSKYRIKEPKESIGEWISKIILESVIKRYGSINGNFISEQDLIGTSNINNNAKVDSSLKFLRSAIVGKLSPFQIKIASFLGYSYVTYEDWIMRKNNLNPMDFVYAIILNLPMIHKTLKYIQAIKKYILNS